MKHETHLPAQQTPQEKNDRVPRPDENSRRPKGHQPAPARRTQDAVRLTPSLFPKEARLRSRREFQRVAKEGQRSVGRYLCVDVRIGEKLKLGISASGRYGASHERNRFKRIVREAFRKNFPLFPPKLELNIIPRQIAKKASMQDIADELIRLLC
jgi:ribonuclease P protein component